MSSTVGELSNKGLICPIIDKGSAVCSTCFGGDKGEGGGQEERKHLLTSVIIMSTDSEIRLVSSQREKFFNYPDAERSPYFFCSSVGGGFFSRGAPGVCLVNGQTGSMDKAAFV